MLVYKPATALITSYQDAYDNSLDRPVLIEPEDLPELLGQVADLISTRATRRIERGLRHHRN
jgi:hypothetical protein